MARPRTPLMKTQVSGAAAKKPQRFRNRKAPRLRPLGEPYVSMTEGERAAWEDFRRDIPWLTAPHRQLLRLACIYAAKLNAGEELGVSAARTFMSLLTKMGATPADETRVNHGDDGEEDDTDRFFSRPN